MQFAIGIFTIMVLAAEPRLFTQATIGLGSICEVKIYEENETRAIGVLNNALVVIQRIDSLLSVFSSRSEISRLNKEKKIRASSELLEAVKRALEVSELTDGAFDISIYPLLDLWGFYRGKKPHDLPSKVAIEKARKAVDYRKIVVRDDSIFLDPDMKIDLGGIAQGFAVDLVCRRLKEDSIKSALVNIGGEVLAIGLKPDGKPWQVGIKNPRGKGVTRVIELADQAVSTSGDYEKFFLIKGIRYPHIINPKTGMPSQGCISVTIIAADASTADALATGVFVLGPEKGKVLLDSLEGVKAVIYVETDGKIESISTGNWPGD